MKILLVCAGGMSTSILMKKMETYWNSQNVELNISAIGIGEYEEVCNQYDIIMVGPQVSYRLNEIKKNSGLPASAINSLDYAIGNCENIMKLAHDLYKQK